MRGWGKLLVRECHHSHKTVQPCGLGEGADGKKGGSMAYYQPRDFQDMAGDSQEGSEILSGQVVLKSSAGTTEWPGLEGTLLVTLFQSPALARDTSHSPGCSELHSAWPWTLPGVGWRKSAGKMHQKREKVGKSNQKTILAWSAQGSNKPTSPDTETAL